MLQTYATNWNFWSAFYGIIRNCINTPSGGIECGLADTLLGEWRLGRPDDVVKMYQMKRVLWWENTHRVRRWGSVRGCVRPFPPHCWRSRCSLASPWQVVADLEVVSGEKPSPTCQRPQCGLNSRSGTRPIMLPGKWLNRQTPPLPLLLCTPITTPERCNHWSPCTIDWHTMVILLGTLDGWCSFGLWGNMNHCGDHEITKWSHYREFFSGLRWYNLFTNMSWCLIFEFDHIILSELCRVSRVCWGCHIKVRLRRSSGRIVCIYHHKFITMNGQYFSAYSMLLMVYDGSGAFLMPIRPSYVVCRTSSNFHLSGWFIKNGLITFLLFGTNVLYKCGFGWIVLKVIFKGRKGQIWLIFHLEPIWSNTVE